MGFQAVYMQIGDEELNKLKDLKLTEILEIVEGFEEQGRYESVNLGKMWDVLHCYMTNKSASNPIWENKLSEFVVGVDIFRKYKNDDPYITCSENLQLKEIIAAAEKLDLSNLKANFDFKTFEANDIYPSGIWEEDRSELISEIESNFYLLLNFYKKSYLEKKNVIISIY